MQGGGGGSYSGGGYREDFDREDNKVGGGELKEHWYCEVKDSGHRGDSTASTNVFCLFFPLNGVPPYNISYNKIHEIKKRI